MILPVVSVIVPACGQVELTRRCVDSVRRWTTDVPWELVLVSNGSTPEEADELAVLVGGDGRFVHFDEMIGYPRAINEGVRLASGEYVCLMNNDAAFTGPWAGRLISQLADGDDVVSPIVDRIGQPCQQLGHVWAPGRLAAVGMLFFVCVVLRRSLFDEIGGMDERFGLGNGEDVVFCEAVKALGGTLLVDPGVFVTHAGSATFLAVLGADGYRELLERNRVLRGPGIGDLGLGNGPLN